MTDLLFLIRHGEVANPNHVVYGDLPGFHLSPTGVLEAHHTAQALKDVDVDLVLSSPLIRAVETATAIGRHHGLTPTVDDRLIESRQFPHWTGNRWDDVAALFPGELDRYLAVPTSVGKDEALAEVADRVISTINEYFGRGHRSIVVVSHQDPIQATRLALLGRNLNGLRNDPPGHAEILELNRSSGSPWREADRFGPQ